MHFTFLLLHVENCWLKRMPLGHCKLAEVVPRLMKSASKPECFTNHSLCVTAATRLII